MATSSRTRSSSRHVLRSLSPSGRYYSPLAAAQDSSLSATASAFASSTSSSFYSRPSNASFFSRRSSSPTRVNVFRSSSSSSSMSPSVRFSIDRSTSPGRSIAVSPRHHVIGSRGGPAKKTCMCSPTTHPGSFRCSLHKNSGGGGHHGQSASSPSNRLNMRRSAMTNSLVRIGGVEGELMRRSLTALIRPSSHHQRRRGAFETRPSRLSVMSKAEDPR
ncbi:uncharacterized serine-rich protein C215.13 [Syzygium oleosum]|uniref:uncharacterized serine-rich protein C215.13 n=1 Tax=Syzygium oleosum TaxID=219896 RepID=UPI0011D28708|nr:uncharacterized serine-rich protein C215.13 [Syzygium oleosum]